MNKLLVSSVLVASICCSGFLRAEALEPPQMLESGIYVPEVERSGYEIYRPAYEVYPKDPNAAMIFSLIMPGLGHLYTENYYWAVGIIPGFFVSTYLAIDNLQLESMQNSDQKEHRDENVGYVSAALGLLIYLYSAQDAHSKARKFNRRQGFKFLMEASHGRIGPQVSLAF
jgi:hypothetical protein